MKHYLFAIILLIGVACKESQVAGDKTKQDIEPTEKMENKTVAQTFILNIDENGVDDMNIGDMIPLDNSRYDKYKFERKTKMVSSEGEEYEEVYYDVMMGNEKVLEIIPGYDIRTDTYVDIISEIIILSDKFQNRDGIGVGTTMDKFLKLYPRTKAYYSYVSDRFWLETGNEQFQYILAPDLNKQDYSNSDLANVPLDKIPGNTRIQKIRFLEAIQ